MPPHVIELGGEEEPDALVREPRARVEALQLAPVPRGLADLLDQLALGAFEVGLARYVELPLSDLDGAIERCEDAKSLIGLMMLKDLL